MRIFEHTFLMKTGSNKRCLPLSTEAGMKHREMFQKVKKEYICKPQPKLQGAF